jgi:hypothetical protein
LKTQTNKIISIIAIVLMSTGVIAIALPANAHTPSWTIPRYAYVTAAPNPVGAGQAVAIVIWTDIPPPTASAGTGDRWTGFTVDVTKPDGTLVHVLTNGVSDPVGSGYCLYTPDAVGTYTIKFSFPDQICQLAGYTGINGSSSQYVGDLFTGASATTTLTVSQAKVAPFVEAQLPVSYWTRPINENNQGWSSIASAWLGQRMCGATYDKFNAYGWAPNTAHVSMLYPLEWGGIVGGGNAISNSMGFYSGSQYNLKFSNPIIMYGNVYFSIPAVPANSGTGLTCVDLRTGQTEWTRPDIASVTIGQLYDGETPNQHGTSGMYLWYSGTVPAGASVRNPGVTATNMIKGTYNAATGDVAAQTYTTATLTSATTAWCAVDPITGQNAFNETNPPTFGMGVTTAGFPSSLCYGPQGEWLYYGLSRPNDNAPYTTLFQWNNTKLPGIEQGGISAWTPGRTTNYNMSTAYDWNVTLDQPIANTMSPIGSVGMLFGAPGSYNASTGINTLFPQILYILPGDLILGQSSGLQTIPGTSAGLFGTPDPYVLWAINLNPIRGPIGHVLFQTAYPAPSGNKTIQVGPIDSQNDVFMIYFRETMQWSGYSALTGQLLWGPLAPQNTWNYYSGTTGLTNPIAVGYGHLYTAGYGGVLYSINCKNGNIDFTWGNDINDPNNSTFTAETVYGEYPTQVAAVANNKIYMVEEEHSLNSPAYHGGKTRCVDAFTGKLLWQVYGLSSWQESAVADGYYTWFNMNDQQVYAMGPGPSATSVSIKDDVVSLGSAVLITGTVTDQTPQAQLKGTAAVADADQEKQMEFLIQHNIDQPNVNGVPVTLSAIDNSGKLISIGQAVSDGFSGTFKMLWTPPAVGVYSIVANFTGTQAYGPSYASTAIGVTAAATPIVTQTPTPTGTTTPTPSAIVTPTPTTAPPGNAIPASTVYAIVAAIVVIIVVAAAAVALRKRK